jgi:hypothetical protein
VLPLLLTNKWAFFVMLQSSVISTFIYRRYEPTVHMSYHQNKYSTEFETGKVRYTTAQSKAVPLCHADAKGDRTHSSYLFLTSALDGGEWSASSPGRALPPGKEPPGTHWIGGWVGLKAGLDTG